MPRPRQVSDAEILTAARDALVADGPAVPVAAVAERLGITAAAVLKRAGSRDALVAAALCPPGPPPFLDALRAPPEPGPLRPQLARRLAQAGAFFAEVVPLLVVARAGRVALPLPPGGPPPALVRAALADFLRAARAAGLGGPAHPDAAADLLLGALESWGFSRWLFHQPPEANALRAYVDTLLDGLDLP